MDKEAASAVALSPTPAAAADEGQKCCSCNNDDHLIYHILCVRSNRSTNFRRYCTSCVLRTHRHCFCPTCFSLHNDPNSSTMPPTSQTPPIRTLACLRCKSYSHFSCVPSNAPKSPYLCPPCSTPNYKFFDVRKPSSNKFPKDGGDKSRKGQYIDLRLSKVLLLAAKIAANSLANAAKLAKQDADQNVRIAAETRKRTREALEVVAHLWATEKENLLKQNSEGTGELSTSVSVSAYAQRRENGIGGRESVMRQQHASVQQVRDKNGGVGGVDRGVENVVSSRWPRQTPSGQKLNDGNVKAVSNHVARRVNKDNFVHNQQQGKGTHNNGAPSNSAVGKQGSHGVPSNSKNLQNNNGKKVE